MYILYLRNWWFKFFLTHGFQLQFFVIKCTKLLLLGFYKFVSLNCRTWSCMNFVVCKNGEDQHNAFSRLCQSYKSWFYLKDMLRLSSYIKFPYIDEQKTQTFTYKHASLSNSRLLILFTFYRISHFPPISWTEIVTDLFVVVFPFHDSWQYFQEALFSDWSTHEDANWYLLNRYWLTNVSSLQSLFSIYITIITLELEGDKYCIFKCLIYYFLKFNILKHGSS